MTEFMLNLNGKLDIVVGVKRSRKNDTLNATAMRADTLKGLAPVGSIDRLAAEGTLSGEYFDLKPMSVRIDGQNVPNGRHYVVANVDRELDGETVRISVKCAPDLKGDDSRYVWSVSARILKGRTGGPGRKPAVTIAEDDLF